MKFTPFHRCSKKEQLERWNQALRVLQNLKPHDRREHWDMSTWGSKGPCGTVACAAGHCGLDPWFRKRGFRLDFHETVDEHWEGNVHHLTTEYDVDLTDVDTFFGDEDFFTDGRKITVTDVIKAMKRRIKLIEADEWPGKISNEEARSLF